MNSQLRARQVLRQNVRISLLATFMVIALAALLYSVYGQREANPLSVGDASPVTYRAPFNLDVIDQLATERERLVARTQIDTVYSANANLERLVMNAVTSAGLPADVQDYVIANVRNPQGITEEGVMRLIEGAVERAPPEREREVRLVLERSLLATSQADTALTEAARQAAANAVEPSMQTLRADQVIVREGETLSEDHLRVLEAAGLYNPRAIQRGQLVILVVGCMLTALLLSLPLAYAHLRLKPQITLEQLVFLAGLTLLVLTAQRLALFINPSLLFITLLPLLVSVLVSELAALFWTIWLALTMALLVPSAPLATLLAVMSGGIFASMAATLFKSRTSLLLAGSLSGLIAASSYSIYLLMVGRFSMLPTLTSFLLLVGGGVLAGILALGLLPVAESNFDFLTDFRLLELSNPSSPLLQRLLLEAPGTYQHSLIISNLVEQAVTNIGGNALLARVGSLYHDVGKLKRPHFFVENQMSGDNPHDRISPHLSFLIITNHVREGVELLRSHKLPKALEPFAAEHHGTTVLSYFYKRALEDSAKLDELNFRYPGPKPQSKETAVLMLADAVESASRSLTEVSQGSIRALIDRLIDQRVQDDQLSESPLNFHDIETIANTFERMLTAILHRRISYPSAEEIQGLKRGGDTRRDEAIPTTTAA